MDFQSLFYLQKVVQTGNISKAAEKLFISRQTISTTISHLEEELGYPLLERSKNGVTLTPEGKVFYSRIEHLFQTGDQLMKDMKEYGKNYRIPLRIGMAPGLEYPLYQALENWQANHPEINLCIEELQGTKSTQRLISGSLDVVFTLMPSFANPDFISEIIVAYPLYMAVHQDHPLAKKDYLIDSDLKGCTFISHTLGYDELEYTGHKYVPFFPEHMNIIYADNWLLNIEKIIHNEGITFAYKGSLIDHVDCIRLIPFQGGYAYNIFMRISNQVLKKHELDSYIRNLRHEISTELTV